MKVGTTFHFGCLHPSAPNRVGRRIGRETNAKEGIMSSPDGPDYNQMKVKEYPDGHDDKNEGYVYPSNVPILASQLTGQLQGV